jgi:hypothetical protein
LLLVTIIPFCDAPGLGLAVCLLRPLRTL